MLRRPTPLSLTLWVSLTALLALAGPADAKDDGAPGDGQKKREKIVLRAFGVPDINAVDPAAMAELRIMGAFRKKFPRIEPTSPTGIQLPGGRNMDMVPLMQIAGGIAPDVMYVNFRQSHSYITMKLLHPLEEFIEGDAGLPSADRGALDTDKYIDALRKAPRYDAMLLEQRVPRQCWEVTRRDCPLGADCRYRRKRGFEPMERHRHVFAFPIAPLAMGMQYDRQLMAEYEDQGVEMRAPKDWDELMRWATIITDPEKKHYGLMVSMTRNPSWYLLSFLYSTGGRIVEEQPDGNWKCVIDTEAAVEAVYFYCRLRWERFKKSDGREIEGVVAVGDEGNTLNKHAMQFTYLDNRFMSVAVDKSKGFGPIPLGPTGIRGGEFNAQMLGIFSGLGEKPERLRAAWEYIQYFDGPEARRLRVEGLVDGGVGEFVRPALLKQFNDNGRYESLIQQSDKALDEIYRTAFESGVPEPYGKNCNSVYDQVDKPLGECLQNDTVKQAIWTNNPQMGKDKIREILKRGAATINEKMLGNLPPAKVRQRQWISWTVIAVVLLLFVWVLKRTYIAFRPPDNIGKSAWQFGRYRFAYLLLLPALLSIGLWAYWPLAKGTAVAFQDYSVLGDSDWVGAKNFAEVLFDREFWYSLRVSLVYGLLYMFFGFWVPIALAFLLSEIPRGGTFFRVVYYLPAVLSGVVVIFLWQSFYLPEGLLNQVLNLFVDAINFVSSWEIKPFNGNWVQDPQWALFMCLLPTVWAGMGPGCLIYLAALKMVPDDTYEAADLDGAGVMGKVFHVAVPAIKALITINFIGAMIGAIRGAGGFVLAMTGGGPYGETGGATEVIGLKLFLTTFGYLKFGPGAAMAWVLGAMLIGFTVLQLQRLSRLEFKTTEKI